LQTVGEYLRAERLKKSLSIKDVESAISIRALYLNAIEEGNYDVVPGEVYLKGFIRNYATFLGLDSQEVMELYRQNKQQPKENELTETAQEVKTVKTAPKKEGGSGLTKWVTVGVLAALIAGGFYWWSAENQPSAPVPPPTTQQQPQQAKIPPVTPSAPANPPAQSVTPANKVVVAAKFIAPCWTQITADGKVIYEGTPKNGESITWEATQKLSVKFGNAGVVDLVYNGKPVGKLGGNGEVVAKTFTLTGIIQ
jgi:cytoskeletal protein RodZ